MTRYSNQTPIHLAGPTPSTDADGDTMTISHVGLTSTPPLIDWATVTVVALSIPGKGTLEIAQSGLPVYDDLGDPSNHPGAGGHAIVRVYYRVIDSKGAIAPNVGYCDIDLATLAAETTPPALASMSPAINATNVDPDVAPLLQFSEKIQQGASGKVLTAWNATTNAAIQTWTIPGDIGSGPGKVQFIDTNVVPRFTAALPNGTKVAFRWDAGFVKDLPGNAVAAQTDDSVCFTTVPAVATLLYPDDPSGWRGRSTNVDIDPIGAIIVDAAGTGSYTTISAAMAAASAGNTIAVKAGVYPEAIAFKAGVSLQGWHTDRPILSAQQPVTGFVQCSAADVGVLGSVLGVAGSPVWKKTGMLKSSVPVTDLLGLAPMENWVPLFNAQDVADPSNPDFQEDESRFHNIAAHGGDYILSGTNIIGVTDGTVINSSRYTNAQLLAAKVRYYGSPNEIYIAQITSADVTAGTIGFANQSKVVDGTGRKRFAIQNIAPAMVAGTFFFVDNGTTFDLYVYPYNPANIDKLTMVARKTIITLPNSGSDIAIRGFRFMGASGPGACEGTAITKVSNGAKLSNITIEHNEFVGGANTGQLHYGAIWLVTCDNILIQHNSFKWCMAHGIFPNGSLSDQNVCTIRRNVFLRCGSASAKAYRQNKWAFVHNYAEKCGYRAHGNLSNVYAGGLDAVWWGNEFPWCNGYLTAQNMQNPNYCFNFLPCDDKYSASPSDRSNRKIANQGATGISRVFNNTAPPVFSGLANTGHMAIYAGGSGMTSRYANNINHGMPVPGDQAGTVEYAKCNLHTHTGYSGSVGGNIDASDFTGAAGKFDTTNVFQPDLSLVYADYANRNWAPASASSPQKTMSTWDIQSEVTGYFIPTFTGSTPFNVPVGDFSLDCKGNPINYAALEMGADQSI